MKKLRVLDLFSGIGGFSLGLERTGGFETVAFCEIEEFPRRVLAKHWPKVPCYHDVRELTADKLAADGISVDVITGGFPCQDLSLAGKKAGMGEGTRSGLWSEIDRLIGELRPQFVIVENVANLLSGPSEQPGGWFGRVLGDLAERGYNAEWQNIPAAAMGAPHLRERAWIVAYPSKERQSETRQFRRIELAQWLSSRSEAVISANDRQERTEGSQSQQISGFSAFSWCEDVRRAEDLRGRSDLPPPLFRGGRDGVPHWVDRIGACGNAVIPQIPELIGHAILEAIARKAEGEAA
ncbi:DNA cytosine methyltransferase [Brucella anthropi]|uniref:DNA cytosine methyltransferase n=1 Tax=Brucella anthropi TaxID=529 RepID=UPI00244D5EF2|nr:DNA cytosine methyltransferase [Brucella anthropi]MDH0367997.1 DNA cytosine methyltransferase [Brucella anthropi]